MDSVRLTGRIVQCFRDVGLGGSQPQLYNLALLCQALAWGRDCHLANLALELPLLERRTSLEQRLQRLLENERFDVRRCYAPLGRQMLRQWRGAEIGLILDRTDIQADVSVLLLGVAYRKRLLPLAWRVLRFGATGADTQLPLLEQVRRWLPAAARVTLLADSEFRTLEVQRWCQRQHWHWQVGVHNTLLDRTAEGVCQPLQRWALQPGQRRYRQHVWLGAQGFGPVNLMADWPVKQAGPHYWALDLPADAQAWRRGRKRYWKRAGFDLEASHIRTPERLEHLLLGMALTSVWLMHIGEWLLRSGRSRDFARRTRDDRLFRLGRDYLERTRVLPGPIPVSLTLAGWAG